MFGITRFIAGMKRFLIFVCLFPALAVAALAAWISIQLWILPDNPEAYKLVAWAYVVCAVPALSLAFADLVLRRTRIPAIIGTAFMGYVIAFAVAIWIFDHGLVQRIVTFGLIGAIPAAVCSWLSNEKPG
ncbi:MAG: hypothetical protein J0I29_12025 [Rhizobiales bacterium]|nr:hypothetical protein [Hyphomicrobiales bacterium]